MEKIDLEYICNQQDLIKLIENHCKEAKKIDLYTCNFLSQDFVNFMSNPYLAYEKEKSLNEWLKKYLLSLAKENVEIQVYNYHSIDEKNLDTENEFYLDDKGEKYYNKQENTIKIIEKQNDNSKILYDFIHYLNFHNEKNLSKVIEQIMNEKNKGFVFLKKGIEEKLKNPLLEKLNSLKELKNFNIFTLQESLKLNFKDLLESTEKIFKEGSNQLIKELLNFFLNVVNIFEIKKIFAKSNIWFLGADVLFEGGKTFVNILEWTNNKYSYAIYNFIIKLFIQDIAPILTLVENNIFHHTLIIDDKILIELSSFKTNIQNAQTYIKQDLAVSLKADKELFKNFKQTSLKNLTFTHQGDELKLYDKSCIEEALCNQMTLDHNRLAYIESPFFNSMKFTQMIKKLKNQNNESYFAKNYLIISNSPRKYNAGLSKKLIEEILENEISYPDITENEMQNDILIKAPKDDYNTTIDYSKYKIVVKDKEQDAFVLSLSPFVCLNYKEYKKYEEIKNIYENLLLNIKYGNLEHYYGLHNFLLKDENVRNLRNYNHIDTFFMQADKKQAFLDKEKEYFKEGVECLQKYIYSITKYKKNVTRYSGTIMNFPYESIEEYSKDKYCVVEVLLLALTYYVIKNFYTSVNTDFVAWWEIRRSKNYESIEVDGEGIDLLPKNVFLVLENDTIPLCFSKKRKDELLENNEKIFCIEDFVETLEEPKEEDFTDKDDETIQTYLKFQEEDINLNYINDEDNKNLNEIENLLNETNENNKLIRDELDNIIKEMQQAETLDYKPQKTIVALIDVFIDKFFPFADFLRGDNFKFAKKLSKTLISVGIQNFQKALYETLGLSYLMFVLSQSNINIAKTQKASKQDIIKRVNKLKKKALLELVLAQENEDKFKAIMAIDEAKLKDIKDSKGFKDLGIEENIRGYKFNFTLHTIKNISKNILESLPQALVQNLMNQLWITEYEKNKREFQKLQFLKFTYKYNSPYAIKRAKEAVFYPMLINNTFLSFNFTSLFIGSRLQTGGLGEKEAILIHHKDTKTQKVKTYLLNKLLAYLCLDELRAMNNSFKIIEDMEFFNSRAYTKDLVIAPRLLKLKNEIFFKTHNLMSENQKNNIEAFNDKLQAINDDFKRQALYKEYKDNEAKGIEAIDAYHKAMDYLDDMQRGAFNTKAYDNSSEPKKHREFLKALDVIGQNNLKAMYVGVNEENEEDKNSTKIEATSRHNKATDNKTKEKRPKLVGRLATTIIMKNGLYIG